MTFVELYVIIFIMIEKIEKKKLTILKILQESDTPIGSSEITEQLQAMGNEVSERTVRFYLLEMDKAGLTEKFGKKGRIITDAGLNELKTARVFDKVGFLTAKIDQMTYRMNFDLKNREGTVVINISILDRDQLKKTIPSISRE